MSSDPRAALARLRARIDAALVALFLAAIAAPTVDEFVRPPEARSPRATELREPAPKPALWAELQAVRRFPQEYEAWYLDSFGLRDRLLRWGSIERLWIFGVSPTDTVALGQDGWMFYRGNASAEVFRGRLPFTPGELRAWQSMLENHADVCASLGAAHVLAIGPNKETIYPERAPSAWTRTGPTRLEQLDRWLEEHASKARFLDLRPALLAEKAHDAPGDHVYFELGTHWNGRGVYAAYRAILEALAPRFPGLAPLRPEEFQRFDGNDQGDTWARAMYVGDLVPQKNHLLVAAPTQVTQYEENGVRVWVSEGPDPKAPRAILFHDSFGESIMYQLAPHFSRLACYWTGNVSDALIDRERPDVVLEVFVERYLVNYVPQDHMLGRGDLSRLIFERSTHPLFVLSPGNVGLLEARGAARVEPLSERGLARVTLSDATGWIALPRFPLSAEGDLLVRLELESSTAGDLLVLPVWKDETAPRRKQFAANRFPAGTSTLHLRVPRTPKLDGLALRIRLDEGTFVLRSLEVRAMPGE